MIFSRFLNVSVFNCENVQIDLKKKKQKPKFQHSISLFLVG